MKINGREVSSMATCEILKDLREKHHLTQEELAERVLVTRQAVSRYGQFACGIYTQYGGHKHLNEGGSS